ncbi:Zinc finger, C2H2 domain and Zinc finger, C2H2-like domain-containing protein [Strongyloides ratti]|uniref:Zinc finger, C2H2 domain and Zinc finger, C2H2-like domain-containing protein n=1 Tax=Strongyloides ratti TaxID=34506 RepID=A0A090LBX5_STRRB|nr:Zinc finger, C2H2 domain and Zinc finger, C2H2-like domain-containing protein [Strongyloides ratti]CEF67237.1 Zinc finger, C2H2 domain and Zinc finger, C2H2-like domain-containing protein [Strongyloides ratti]
MDELNCTLCNKESLTKRQAVKHIFKDHLNYIPWICSKCNFKAYTITDKHVHENETIHTMIESEKYSSNFRIFSIIYCDMRYIKKFGEENLDRCRILRPSVEMAVNNIICNGDTVSKNIDDSKNSCNIINEKNFDNTENSRLLLTDENVVQKNYNVPKLLEDRNFNNVNRSFFDDKEFTTPKDDKINNSFSKLSIDLDISSRRSSNKTKEINEISILSTKNIDNSRKRDRTSVSTTESQEILGNKRKARERITFEKDNFDDSSCVDIYEKPNKRLRCSYDVLKPTLSTNKYLLEYAFILDRDEISNLLSLSNITNCKLCRREIRNEYDVLQHIQLYHNNHQEFESPILSCAIKRCEKGFDDIYELRKHFRIYHSGLKFVNNIDVNEKRRDKCVYVNISANNLLKYEQLFIDCFPNLIYAYCGKPIENRGNVQLFLSYSSEKCDYLNSEYFYKKAEGKSHIECGICNKKIPVERYLIRHVMESHMDRNNKKYNILACQECKEPKYYDISDLEQHWQRVHSKIGPFFNNYHIEFDKIPMQYTCVASTMSKDDLKAYEIVFEQAYPSLKIEL